MAMWVVTGKEQHFIRPEVVNDLEDLIWLGRRVERLHSQVDVFPDVL